MFTQIGAKPESDFSEPLGMLGDCHKRIQFFLNDLVRMAQSASYAPLDDAERRALERALRYFRESGPRHTSDEEESLFPRLRALRPRAIENDRVDELLAKIDSLETDHQRADRAHIAINAIGVCWLADGVLRSEEAVRLRSLLRDLSEMYERHLAVEDREIFPAAAALLSDQEKRELGREMAARRGLSPEIAGDAPRQARPSSRMAVKGEA